jgi:maleate cis-trans isomerase
MFRSILPTSWCRRALASSRRSSRFTRRSRSRCLDGADGVLIAGTGFRCVAVLDTLEQDLGHPVVSANQASRVALPAYRRHTHGGRRYGSLMRV